MKRLAGIIVGAIGGLAYGLFFAQKSGKEFRNQLKDSENPLADFLDELKKTGEESGTIVKHYVEGSEELQGVIVSGKEQFENLTDKAKTLSKEATENLAKELDLLSKNAADSANKLKKDATRKVTDLKKEAGRSVQKLTGSSKKTVSKKVTPKKIVKKVANRVTKKKS